MQLARTGYAPTGSHYWPAQTSLQPDALSYRLNAGTLQRRLELDAPPQPQARPALGSFAAAGALQPVPAAPAGDDSAFSRAQPVSAYGSYQDMMRASSLYKSTSGLAPAVVQQPQQIQHVTQAMPSVPPTHANSQPHLSQHGSQQELVLSQLIQGLNKLTNEVSELKAGRTSIDSTQGENSCRDLAHAAARHTSSSLFGARLMSLYSVALISDLLLATVESCDLHQSLL